MAREWSIDIDSLRLHYVHQLYLYGCDPLADEVKKIVKNKHSLFFVFFLKISLIIFYSILKQQTKKNILAYVISIGYKNIMSSIIDYMWTTFMYNYESNVSIIR